MTQYWIVICPETKVRGGIWLNWFDGRCLALGWPPPTYPFRGPTDDRGWSWTRRQIEHMSEGDRVIPFLQKWRLGPVGTITALRVTDEEWNPTVARGAYAENPQEAELGRRIEVEWESSSMPPRGQVAIVTSPPRPGSPRPLARHAVEPLSEARFNELVRVVRNPHSWTHLKE
jgi:hypothetical protein